MFKHLEAFHTDNSARQSSVESDYGVRRHLQPWRHTWRVFYIRSTGELYAVYLVGAGPVFLLGTFPPDEPVDSRDRWYRCLDELLDGWADHCNAMDGLTWVMDRLQSPTRVSP